MLEPAGSVTDLVLALVAFALAGAHNARDPRGRYWTAAFLCAGVGALLGTVYHGWLKSSDTWGFPTWTVITLWVAVTVSFLLSGTVATLVGAGRARFWLGLRTLGLAAFAVVAVTGHAGMGTLMATESVTMAAILWLWVRAWRRGVPGAAVIMGAIGASALGGMLRVTPVSFTAGWEFDGAALYHLAQMAGLVLLYVGLGGAAREGLPSPAHADALRRAAAPTT